jgi:hypothetical protein
LFIFVGFQENILNKLKYKVLNLGFGGCLAVIALKYSFESGAGRARPITFLKNNGFERCF